MSHPENVTNSAFSGTLRRVRALLDKADSTSFPEEAATYRAKAEELMLKYRIEEENLLAADPTSAEPVRIDITLCSPGIFQNIYVNLWHSVSKHVGVSTRYRWVNHELVAQVVGYESDTRYAEALFTGARTVFTSKMEPRFDPTKSDRENIYRLRSSGMPRNRVAELVFGASPRSDGAAFHAKVGRIYKEECAARGEAAALSGKGIDLDTFRLTYADEFDFEVWRRLAKARDAANSSGGTMVLKGRDERVEEAFYREFPEMRPAPVTEVATTDNAPAKPRKRTAKERAEGVKMHHSKAALAGRAAGRDAASEVEIRGVTTTQRLAESETIGCFELGN